MNDSSYGTAHELMLLPDDESSESSNDGEDSSIESAQQEKVREFFTQVWPRLITREQLIKRLWMRCPAPSGKDTCLTKSLDSMTVDPIALVENPENWIQSDSFFWGASRISHLAYNLLYLATLVADLSELVRMSPVTYRSGIVEAIFGFAKNKEPYDASLTSVLGNDRPDTIGFWVGFTSLYILPIVVGLISARVNSKRGNNAEIQHVQGAYIGREKNIFKLVRYAYLYERLSRNDDRREFINEKLEVSRAERKDLYCFSRFTASYLQWSIGASNRVADHIGFNLLVTPYNILAYWNYRRLLFMKLALIVGYSISRVQCQNKGYYYSWIQALGDYFCDPCALDYVDVKSRHSVEGCFNRTLAHSRPVDTLIQDLQSIKGRLPYLKELKLSYQNWTQFNRLDLTRFLDALSQLFPNVLSLDISSETPVKLVTWQANLMSSYLKNISSLEAFDVSGLEWPNKSIALLANSISGQTIQKLTLDNTNLNSTGLYYWINGIKDQLRYLSCARGSFSSNDSESLLLPSVPALKHLDFSSSKFDQINLEVINNWFSLVSPEVLILSGVDLSELNSSLLFLASKSSKEVQFSNCNFNDKDLMDIRTSWVNGSIRNLDISDNYFSYLGFLQLREIILRLEELSIAYNDMTGSIYDLCDWLQESAITSLNIAGVLLSPSNQRKLFNAVANSSVSYLVTSDMGLTDEAVIYASDVLQTYQSKLTDWDLSNNRASNTSLSVVLSRIPNRMIRSLFLSGNDVSGLIDNHTWNALVGASSQLEEISLRSTQMSDENALRLMQSLNVNSTLKKLLWGYNPFDLSTFRVLNQRLRSGPDYLLNLNENETNNMDYNYENYMNAPQNNRLESYEVAGIPSSVDVMRELCQETAYTDSLNISGLIFDADQLALSTQVDIDGCPAAISAATALSLSFPFMMSLLFINLYALFFSRPESSGIKSDYRSDLYQSQNQFTTVHVAARR